MGRCITEDKGIDEKTDLYIWKGMWNQSFLCYNPYMSKKIEKNEKGVIKISVRDLVEFILREAISTTAMDAVLLRSDACRGKDPQKDPEADGQQLPCGGSTENCNRGRRVPACDRGTCGRDSDRERGERDHICG